MHSRQFAPLAAKTSSACTLPPSSPMGAPGWLHLGLGSLIGSILLQVSPFARASQVAPDDSAAGNPLPTARAVSWQDMVGRDLVTVREFEPSEAGGSDASHGIWGHSEKSCCCLM